MLTKRLEKKLDGNYTRMLRAILNKSWRQHSTRHQLYGHLSPITKTIQARRARHAGHCWRSRDELISDVLLWTPTYGRAKAGRPARTYIQQLCELVGWLVVWVLWHINPCRSFNAKFCLYIHTYSTKDFKTNIKVGRIFYLQDFLCLHKINQF